jgi:hypothetical protein
MLGYLNDNHGYGKNDHVLGHVLLVRIGGGACEIQSSYSGIAISSIQGLASSGGGGSNDNNYGYYYG